MRATRARGAPRGTASGSRASPWASESPRLGGCGVRYLVQSATRCFLQTQYLCDAAGVSTSRRHGASRFREPSRRETGPLPGQNTGRLERRWGKASVRQGGQRTGGAGATSTWGGFGRRGARGSAGGGGTRSGGGAAARPFSPRSALRRSRRRSTRACTCVFCRVLEMDGKERALDAPAPPRRRSCVRLEGPCVSRPFATSRSEHSSCTLYLPPEQDTATRSVAERSLVQSHAFFEMDAFRIWCMKVRAEGEVRERSALARPPRDPPSSLRPAHSRAPPPTAVVSEKRLGRLPGALGRRPLSRCSVTHCRHPRPTGVRVASRRDAPPSFATKGSSLALAASAGGRTSPSSPPLFSRHLPSGGLSGRFSAAAVASAFPESPHSRPRAALASARTLRWSQPGSLRVAPRATTARRDTPAQAGGAGQGSRAARVAGYACRVSRRCRTTFPCGLRRGMSLVDPPLGRRWRKFGRWW